MSGEMTPHEQSLFNAGVRAAKAAQLAERGRQAWAKAANRYPHIKDAQARECCDALVDYAKTLERRIDQLENIGSEKA